MDESILRKIRALIALASSSNPNEAAAAMQKAQVLMARHGVSEEDMELSAVRKTTSADRHGTVPPVGDPVWETHLAWTTWNCRCTMPSAGMAAGRNVDLNHGVGPAAGRARIGHG